MRAIVSHTFLGLCPSKASTRNCLWVNSAYFSPIFTSFSASLSAPEPLFLKATFLLFITSLMSLVTYVLLLGSIFISFFNLRCADYQLHSKIKIIFCYCIHFIKRTLLKDFPVCPITTGLELFPILIWPCPNHFPLWFTSLEFGLIYWNRIKTL